MIEADNMSRNQYLTVIRGLDLSDDMSVDEVLGAIKHRPWLQLRVTKRDDGWIAVIERKDFMGLVQRYAVASGAESQETAIKSVFALARSATS